MTMAEVLRDSEHMKKVEVIKTAMVTGIPDWGFEFESFIHIEDLQRPLARESCEEMDDITAWLLKNYCPVRVEVESFDCPNTWDLMTFSGETSSAKALIERSAMEKCFAFTDIPLDSSKVWGYRILITSVKPSFNFLRMKQLMITWEMQCEWLEFPLGNLRSDLAELPIAANNCDYAKFPLSESVDEIPELEEVKPGEISWNKKVEPELDWSHWTMEPLENYLPRKYPATGCKRIKGLDLIRELVAFLNMSKPPVISSDRKPANILLDETTTNLAHTPNNYRPENAKDAGDFTDLDISSAARLSETKDVETKTNQPSARAFRNKYVYENAFQWRHQPSDRQKSLPMNIKSESQRNVYNLLLLICSLLATITFHTALKTPEYVSEEGYKYNNSQNPFYQTGNQHSYSSRLFILLNSAVFFLSIALLIRLFNELPFRPLLHISAFSMLGAYMCTMSDPLNSGSWSS